jgi:Mg2+ and Co2+ transporter CorA
MNKKILYILSIFFTLLLISVTNGVYADEASSTEKSNKATSSMGEQHRNRVSKVVQELNNVADRDGGIGSEVKLIAQEERNISEKIKEKMDEVEERSGFKTFFIGSDYKNLGALRSDLITTGNHIEKLTKALEKATSSTTQAELEEQIEDLIDIQEKAESFAKRIETKFSLFGWLVKMFD